MLERLGWPKWMLYPCLQAFRAQRANAGKRKPEPIEWLLTFEEWLEIWVESGHLHERGRKAHEYCMARGTPEKPDVGPYAVGNVRIITCQQNWDEQKPTIHTKEFKLDLSKRSKGNQWGLGNRSKAGQEVSAETRAKLSAAGKGRKRPKRERVKISAGLMGHEVSAETRAKIGAAHRGSKRSAATRAKMSKAHRGLKKSAETRKKQSESAKRAWLRRQRS